MKRNNAFISTFLVIMMLVTIFAASGCSTNSANNGTVATTESTNETSSASSSTEPEVKVTPTSLNLWWFPLWSGVNGEVEGKADDWPKAKAKEFMDSNPNITKINIEMLTWENGILSKHLMIWRKKQMIF